MERGRKEKEGGRKGSHKERGRDGNGREGRGEDEGGKEKGLEQMDQYVVGLESTRGKEETNHLPRTLTWPSLALDP
jgi:hypothetical protein